MSVSISRSANTLDKYMNPTVLAPAMRKKTNLMTTRLEEKKIEFKAVLDSERDGLSKI